MKCFRMCGTSKRAADNAGDACGRGARTDTIAMAGALQNVSFVIRVEQSWSCAAPSQAFIVEVRGKHFSFRYFCMLVRHHLSGLVWLGVCGRAKIGWLVNHVSVMQKNNGVGMTEFASELQKISKRNCINQGPRREVASWGFVFCAILFFSKPNCSRRIPIFASRSPHLFVQCALATRNCQVNPPSSLSFSSHQKSHIRRKFTRHHEGLQPSAFCLEHIDTDLCSGLDRAGV